MSRSRIRSMESGGSYAPVPEGQAIPFRLQDVEQPISNRFEKIVDLVPDRPALRVGSKEVTYAALDRQANQIGHAILKAVPGGREVVATLLSHNQGQIAALLGILKSGRAYVALDPATPERVMQDILRDSQATLLLTDRQNQEKAYLLPSDIPKINLDLIDPDTPDNRPAVPSDPHSMAYLVYTSGSTGIPKGVIKSHAEVLFTTYVAASDYSFRGTDRISLLVSMSFAAARFGFLGALLNGATLCLYDLRAEGLDGLAPWLTKEGITIFHTLPSTLRTALEKLPDGLQFEQVRYVVVGGEPLTRHDLELYQRHFLPSCRMINTYAASEAGVICRLAFDHSTQAKEEILPVGYPVEGVEITLDPSGVASNESEGIGEICVRSRTISQGYWQDPELTQSKFSVDPEDPLQRSYRTGDLGRTDPDGCLWTLGRIDQQIKIHGQRAHLEAVESALERHPGIRSAAVLLSNLEGRSRLLALLVPAGDRFVASAELRQWLLKTLPQAMLPAQYHFLEELPRTPVGKVDRAALLELELDPYLEAKDFSAAHDPIERTLVEIWEQVLDLKPISIEDDYFNLGGDSLRATQLFSRIERALGVRLPMASLFRAPTIEAQAALIRQGDTPGKWPALVAVQPLGSRLPFYCVSPLVVDVLAYRDLALQIGLDQPFYALFANEGPVKNTTPQTVQEKASRYIDELKALQADGPYFLGGYSNGGKIAFEMAVQLSAMGEDVSQLILLETYGPQYLQRGSRARWSFVRRLQYFRRLQRSLSNFTPWVRMHLQALRSQNWQGRSHYLRAKTEHRIQMLKARITRQYARLLDLSNRDQDLYKTPTSRAVYAYQPPVYRGDVTIIRAEKQLLGVRPDPYLGWRDFIAGKVSLVEVPGFHDSILFGPRVGTLANQVRKVLEAGPSEQAAG